MLRILSSAQSYMLRKCLTLKKKSIISSHTGFFLCLSRNFCMQEKHAERLAGNVPQLSTIIYSLSHIRLSESMYLLHFSRRDVKSFINIFHKIFTLKEVFFNKCCTIHLPCSVNKIMRLINKKYIITFSTI